MLVRPRRMRVTAFAVARMSRPDHLALILVVFATGLAAGAADRGADAGLPVAPSTVGLALAAAALLLVAASVHVVNEYADTDTDALTRRTRFSGGSGALSEETVPRHTALVAAVVMAIAGLVVGLFGWIVGALPTAAVALLAIGLVGGWLYSVGPFALSRHGWGEVANAVLGGLVLPVFGVALVTGMVSVADVAVFVPFALLVFVNLLETQWPDRAADRAVGKHTLTSRLSARAVRRLATSAVVAAYLLVVLLAPDPLPAQVAAASLLALPLSAWGLVRLTRNPAPLPSVLAMVTMVVAQGIAWAT